MNRYAEEVVIITIPQTRPKEVTRELALSMLGSIFTNTLISDASKKNHGISGFSEDAESCFKKTEAWQKKTFVVKFLTMLGFILGALSALAFVDNYSTFASGMRLVVGSATAIITACVVWSKIQKHYPGKTALVVGKAWGKRFHKYRDTAFSVSYDFSVHLKSMLDQDVNSWSIFSTAGSQRDSVILSMAEYAIDKKLCVHAKETLLADRDGHLKAKKLARKKLSETSRFAKAFGLEKDWSKAFETARLEIQ
jgi:hypothetical protein